MCSSSFKRRSYLLILVLVKEQLLTQHSVLVVLKQFVADTYARISQKYVKIKLLQVSVTLNGRLPIKLFI